jgi:hypothetical protein
MVTLMTDAAFAEPYNHQRHLRHHSHHSGCRKSEIIESATQYMPVQISESPLSVEFGVLLSSRSASTASLAVLREIHATGVD